MCVEVIVDDNVLDPVDESVVVTEAVADVVAVLEAVDECDVVAVDE